MPTGPNGCPRQGSRHPPAGRSPQCAILAGDSVQFHAGANTILFRIVVIGEAAKAVVYKDPALATDLSDVEWSALARMRDRITHQYWAIDSQIVWDTAREDIPDVRGLIAGALARLT